MTHPSRQVATICMAGMLIVTACSGSDSSTAPTGSASVAVTTTQEPTTASTSAPTTSVTTAPLSNPRGSAINGSIFYARDGDIFALDPATGTSTVIVGGPTKDEAPIVSPDGTKLVFFRGDDEWVYRSNVDGSGVARWVKGSELSFWEWSPDGSKVASIRDGGTSRDLVLWDGGAGPRTPISVDTPAALPSWADEHTLVLTEEVKDSLAVNFWAVNTDGTGLRKLPALHPSFGGSLDTHTGRLVYSDFDIDSHDHASVHVLDVATGTDTVLASTAAAPENFIGPKFSPDGHWIIALSGLPGRPGRQVLLAADGSGVALGLTPAPAAGSGWNITFSPDSTRVLITREDGAFLYSIPEGAGGRVAWTSIPVDGENPPSWQRLPG